MHIYVSTPTLTVMAPDVDVITLTTVVCVCVCAVLLVLTHSSQRVVSIYQSKLEMTESIANQLVFITVNFYIRKCCCVVRNAYLTSSTS